MTHPLKVLLVEDNPAHCLLFKEFIRIRKDEPVEVLNAGTVASAIDFLRLHVIDVIVLDLYLPDSEGLDTFYRISAAAAGIPVIILSGSKDSTIALAAIKHGAQDYLIKGDYNEKVLYKAIYYSIERKRIEEKLRLSNERYELLAQATSEAVWDMNFLNNRITYWNNGMETLFGYSAATIDGSLKWWMDRIHDEDKTSLLKVVEGVREKKYDHFSVEFRFRCADEQFKHVLVRAYVIYRHQELFRMIGSMQDIHPLRSTQEALAKEQIKLQQLITEKTIEVQEQERAELGRELHDNISQLLASARVCLETAICHEENRTMMMQLGYKHLGIAMTEIRRMSHELTPPSLGDIGLKEAVDELIMPITAAHPIKIRHRIHSLTIRPAIQLMIYRIIQEQIHNIIKYASASDVTITVRETERELKLAISDNGVGFDPQVKTDGIGLRNIKSRAQVYGGIARIVSSPGHGCSLRLAIPLTKVKTT